MKTTPLILAMAAGLTISLSPARAEEPAPPAVSPDVQALLGELAKLGAGANGKEDPQIDIQALFGMLLKMVPAAAAQAGDAPKAAVGKDVQGQELQAQLTELVKALTKMAADDAPAPTPDPAANPASAPSTTGTPSAKPAPAAGANPRPSNLSTGSLSGASLAPSSSLNGRGTAGGTPKLTDSEWRSLFPARDGGK